MLRSRIVPLALVLLALPLALGGLVRAQDDDDGTDEVRAQLTVKDGRVRVKLHLADGRSLDRELSPEELFRRLGTGDDHPLGERLGRVDELDRRIERLKERIARLRSGDQTARPDDDDEGVLDEIERTLRELPDRLQNAFDELKKNSDRDRVRELEERIDRTIRDALENLRSRREAADRVHVSVDGAEMIVPGRKGRARLY
jgi:hypothetical protein